MKRGFTLIEAVLVIAILAILTYVSVVSFTPALSYKKAAAAAKIRSDIQYAQSLAMMTRQSCGITFSGNTYTVFENGNTYDPAVDPVTRQDYTISMNSSDYAGVTISSDFGGTSVVQFDREGTPTDGSGSALPLAESSRRVTVGGDVYVVVTQNTGRVSVQ
jgi:prepilin-type N-terminal cleavage/methylation domain-containing protein